MGKHMLRSFAVAALLLGAVQSIVCAQEPADAEHEQKEKTAIEGVWTVNVTIRDCQTGDVIRSARALNLFIHDGSLTETAVNVLRTPSVGSWKHFEARTYTSTFTFFRYNPDGTFASRAKVTRTIELSHDRNHFKSTGIVEDFDENDLLISRVCPTETANRPE